MANKGLLTAMAGVAILTPSLAFAQQDRVSATEKGSLLIFSKVEIRWDADGNVIQDTFIDISNDFPEDVRVLMYFVNGDAPLDKCDKVEGKETVCDGGTDGMGMHARRHPGWNWVDNEIMLTKNEPTYWSALTGQPKGVSPFTVLDPDPTGGMAPGRPANDGSGDRVLRGMIYAWAINADGEEIRWNHLKGDATIVNYDENSAWEYNAWSFQVVSGVANGAQTGDPGTLNLDGAEYALAFDQLLMDFYASNSTAFSNMDAGDTIVLDTDLTLHPVSLDARQETDGPVTTKAHFDVWNEYEVKFSGAYRCITCWDQWLLSDHGIPNHFLVGNLQTDKGKARIDGLASQLCDFDNDPKDQKAVGEDINDIVSIDAAILGVVAKHLDFDMGGAFARAGTNLFGLGTEAAVVKYDQLGAPPEATAPGDVLQEGLDTIRKALSNDRPTSNRSK